MSIHTEHQEFIRSFLMLDLEAMHENNERLKIAKQNKHAYEEQLEKLKVFVDRPAAFESTLNKLLDKNVIGLDKKEAIISYIKLLTQEKKLMSDGFDFRNSFFIQHRSTLQFPSGQRVQVWEALIEASELIDKAEDKLTVSALAADQQALSEYQELRKKLNDTLAFIDQCEKQNKQDEADLSKVFQTESISNIKDYNTLRGHWGDKTLEILVLEPEAEGKADLAAVIQMRAKKNHEKGREFLVLSFEDFTALMASNEPIQGVTKLSFLAHGDKEFGFLDNISKYINQLPQLTDIVLRGCGTAKEITPSEAIYVVRKANEPYEKKPSIQGESQLVIQQTESEEGKILTKISWVTYDPENNAKIRHEKTNIEGLPLITKKRLTEDQLQLLEQIPGVPLLQHEDVSVKAQRNLFFNKKETISAEDLAKTKKAVRRARTETKMPLREYLEQNYNDLLSQTLNKMEPEQKNRISVKAYIGGYEVRQGRVVPERQHDQEKYPKALRLK